MISSSLGPEMLQLNLLLYFCLRHNLLHFYYFQWKQPFLWILTMLMTRKHESPDWPYCFHWQYPSSIDEQAPRALLPLHMLLNSLLSVLLQRKPRVFATCSIVWDVMSSVMLHVIRKPEYFNLDYRIPD